MKFTKKINKGKSIATLGAASALIIGTFMAVSASAAPPQQVTYKGTPVKTAVPGKSFTVNWKVTNTTSDVTYSNVSVIYHVPSGMTSGNVSPANAEIIDDTITWKNVPLAPGESLYPSIAFTLDSDTPLKTKKNIWVEVTGDSMESTSSNFSITAVSSTPSASSSSTSSTLAASTVDYLFAIVYGRLPTTSEATYWQGRRTDKPKRLPLLGAMQFHKIVGINH